jgi:hypothetical protein
MATTLNYTAFERLDVPRPVHRIQYIAQICAGKSVLDLGAMDETAYASKRGRGVWLHEEISKTASRVVGLDSSNVLPSDGLRTAENAEILRGDILDVASFLQRTQFSPDIVVAGELIEHLENPLAFLRSFQHTPALQGKALLLSTPNATAFHNSMIGLGNRESSHADHLCILSFKTLTTLASRAGFSDWRITPYHSDFAEMKLRNSGLRRALVVSGEGVVRMMERMFPLLSFGLILETQIKA